MLVHFLKCCYEAEDEGVQVTTVAMLVLGSGKCGRQMVRWMWENDGANRGCCTFFATLAVDQTFPTRGPRHEADVLSPAS